MKKLILYIFTLLVFSIFFEQVCSYVYNHQINTVISSSENSSNQLLEEINDGFEFILPEKKQNFWINVLVEPLIIENWIFYPKKSTYIWQPPEFIS